MLFFAYGTLMTKVKSLLNDLEIENSATDLTPYYLHDIHVQAHEIVIVSGFPNMIRTKNSMSYVHGELFDIPISILPLLEEYEGELYKLDNQIIVYLPDEDKPTLVSSFVNTGPKTGLYKIESGSYYQYLTHLKYQKSENS
jgi:gamma-glutamylcyclotransferase (GGCT)/AIG2-like uncharacterized protein YtfP